MRNFTGENFFDGENKFSFFRSLDLFSFQKSKKNFLSKFIIKINCKKIKVYFSLFEYKVLIIYGGITKLKSICTLLLSLNTPVTYSRSFSITTFPFVRKDCIKGLFFLSIKVNV